MSGKLIKNYRDFPEWFKNKKYADLHTTEEWRYEIKLRAVIDALLLKSNIGPLGEKQFVDWISQEDFPLAYCSGVNEPIIDMSICDVLYLNKCIRNSSVAFDITKIDELFSEGLRVLPEVPNGRLIPYEYERMLDDVIRTTDDDTFDWLNGSAFEHWPGVNPWLSYANALEGRPISVDTELDDKTLVESFKGWLANVRKEESEKVKRPYSESDFEKWNRYKLLQVFDIDAWSKITGVRITDNALASVLWPDNDMDAEDISPLDRLRKVTRRTILSVISYKSACRLASQVEIEIASQEESGKKMC